MPQNIEAEFGVLGALLVEESIVGEIISLLHSRHFSLPAHQSIYEAICTLFENHRPIGPISVKEELQRRGVLEQVGGEAYLLSLMEAVFSAGNSLYNARVVREKGIMRQLIEAARHIEEETQSGRYELDALLDKAEKTVFEVTQSGISSEPVPIQSILVEIVNDLEKKGKNIIHGISSGFPDLDNMTAGLVNSSLIIIAGRPSMGKTTFALNIATHVGVHQNIGVLIFSLEMSKDQVCQNMVCSQVKISPHKIRTGTIDSEEYRTITTEVGWLSQAPIYVDDTAAISMREIRAKARRLKAKCNIGLVIIDYIQLIETGGNKPENRQQEISQISRGLKSLARELNVPVIALSQLNRSVDARDDHRPRMSDLRESGALEQDADLIIFLYREEYYDKNSPNKGSADVIVSKHRNGPTGDLKFAFYKEYMRFYCMEQRERFTG